MRIYRLELICGSDSPEYKLGTGGLRAVRAFEDKIGTYIEKELGSSIELFYETLQRRTDEDPNSNEAVFGQILVSVCDFDIFVTALKEGVKMKNKADDEDRPPASTNAI